MAAVDPYSSCPCGSGEKFKWCCHKVEAVADRAHRLFETGQYAGAVDALDEGLSKEPGNAWLLTRKALYLTKTNRPEPAKAAVKLVLQKNPGHAGAQMLMTRLVLETEGPVAGVAQLQEALTAFPIEKRKDLAGLVRVVGAFLSEVGEYAATLKHLRLALALGQGDADQAASSMVRSIESNPLVSAWQKNPDELAPAPEAASAELKARFEQARQWASEGLWSSAASAFETLRSEPVVGPLADRNLGFCRLWLADDQAAASALRRYVAKLGNSAEAVDIEALCQQISPPGAEDEVEHVELTWPLRDRGRFIQLLEADRSVNSEGTVTNDPDDPESPELDSFALLDRPEIKQAGPALKMLDMPRIVGRILVGQQTATLESYDDGRLDRLTDRFTAIAGSSIAPAHPRTKVLDKIPKLQLALMWEWLMPEGLGAGDVRRVKREQGVHLIGDVWPSTPNPAFRGRTPLQAAKEGNAEVPLRASLLQFELAREAWRDGFDFGSLRKRLNVPYEPAIDPARVDIATVHLARLPLVPAEKLSDEKLALLYKRARQASIEDAIVNAAKALVKRPEALERLGIESITVYTDLAALAASQDRQEEAAEWITRGRQADTPPKKIRNAPAWDIFEVRLMARTAAPESWVPELAVVLERYRQDAPATQAIMVNLVEMGLLEMVQSPDRPGEIMLDSRPLQALMAEYGPRVTTASGRLGVSAGKPEIWTPGGGGGKQGGGLWTPGSGSSSAPPAQPGTGGKLIVPGR